MQTEIFDSIFKSLQKILLKYPYVKLSDEFIKNFISDKVNKEYEKFENKRAFVNYVSKLFEKTINALIKASLESEAEYLDLINNYLELARLKVENSDKDLVLLTNLVSFLNKFQFESTPEKLVKIIRNNLYLFNTIKYFIEKNNQRIANGSIRRIVTDDNVFSFIEAYCMYHGIEIGDILDEENKTENQEETTDDELSEFGNDSYYNEDSEKLLEREIRQYDVLSPAEQKELIRQYQNGDERAKDKLVETNLRLVLSIAKKNRGRGVDVLDLFQEGTAGLITAITKFDLNMNCTLSTYATWWIKQAITRTIQYHAKTIRIPVHMLEASNKLIRVQRDLVIELGREPTNVELAKKLKISEKKLLEICDAQKSMVSLNAYVNDDNDTEMGDLIPSEENSIEDSFIEQTKSQDVMNLLNRVNLTEREIDVLIRRFGILDGRIMKLEEIASIYGVTRERIRQIETKAINKLRRSPYTKSFASYMANPSESLENLEGYRSAYVNAINTNKKFIDRSNLSGNRVHKLSAKHTIYKYLSEFSKESIDAFIENLSPASKELLRIRFGNDLENPIVSIVWNDEYHRRFNKLLNYMKKYLENPNYEWRIKPIYRHFPKYDSLEVDLAIATLTDEEQALLKLRYGENFHYPTYNVDWEYDLNNDVQLHIIIGKISQILLPRNPRRTGVMSKSNINNIYDYFSGFEKDRIDLIVSLLSQEERRLLKMKFGSNLDEYYTRPKWGAKEAQETTKLFNKMKRQLSDPEFGKRYTIYDLLPNYSKEEIDLAISKITNDENRGKINYFLEHGILTREDKRSFRAIEHLIIKIIKKMRENGLEKTIYEIYSEYDVKVVDYVLASLSKEDADLLSLKFGTDFHVPALKRELLAGHQKKIDELLDKIKQLLVEANNKNNIQVIDIYNYFAEYPKKEVADVISRLSEEELNLLKLKFGDRLTLYSRKSNLSEEQTKRYKILLNKIRRKLTNPVKGRKKKFFDVFSDYEVQDINNALKILSESDRNYLKYYYGKDLNEYPIDDANVAKKIWGINVKIRRQLENFKTERISIYTYFREYAKEDVDLMLSNLNEQELFLLKKKFCDDLSCMIKRVNWTDEESKAFIALSAKMRRKLKNPTSKMRLKKAKAKEIEKTSIYDYFKEYTKEDIDLMLSKLLNSELIILRKKFGENLDCLIKRVSWSEEESKAYIALSAKMRRLLKNPKPKVREKKSKEIKQISIYEYFKKYTKDEVDMMISKLYESELKLLYKKFGSNLDSLVRSVNWSEKEAILYKSLYSKMHRLLKNPNYRKREKKIKIIEKISIYQYFKDYTIDEVNVMLAKLTENELKILHKKFGNNLDNLEKRVVWDDGEQQQYVALSARMRRLLKNPVPKTREKKTKQKVIEKISIYEYFKDYSEEDVNVMLSKLSEDEMNMMYRKFGNQLDCLVKRVKWSDEEAKVFKSLSAKVRRLLKNPNPKVKEKKTKVKEVEKISIYQYFNKYTEDEINKMLARLNASELIILRKKFGEELDNLVKRVNWNEEEHKLYIALYSKIQRILKSPNRKPRVIKPKKVKEQVSIYAYFSEYSEEAVNAMLAKLSDSELKILYKKFGNNLDCLVRRVNWIEAEQKQYKALFKRMHRLLKNPNPIIREKKVKEVFAEKITIYQYFKDYSLDDVNAMLAKLTEKELEILHKKFGENLDCLVKRVDWDNGEQRRYTLLMTKIKRLLSNPNKQVRTNPRKNKNLYDMFGKYSREMINQVLSSLTSGESDVLISYYGADLTQRIEGNQNCSDELNCILDKIAKNLKTQCDKPMSIYDYFSSYSRDAVDKMLAKLTYGEKYLLMQKFDVDFSRYQKTVNWSEEDRKKYVNLLSKMKRILAKVPKPVVIENKDLMTIYEIFKGYSKAQVDYAVSTLNSQDKYSIKSRYGEDLSKAYVKPDKSSQRLIALLNKVRQKLALLPASEQPKSVVEKQKRNLLKKEQELKVRKVATTVEFNHILSLLPRVEAVILELKFGLYDKIYTTEEIARLFNKTELDIIRLIRCALEDAKVLATPVSEDIINIMQPQNEIDVENKLVLARKED